MTDAEQKLELAEIDEEAELCKRIDEAPDEISAEDRVEYDKWRREQIATREWNRSEEE